MPLTTQYSTLQRVINAFPLTGAGTFELAGAGSLTVVTTVVESSTVAEHRFRGAVVPPLEDFDAVQRHLQRAMDEVARAVNPVRSIADGGTGLQEVTTGALVTGSDATSMETVAIGPTHSVLVSSGGMPAWSSAPPKWQRFTVASTDFATAATTNTKTIYALPARSVIHAAVIKHSVAFLGGAITAYTISVGISGTPTKYTPALNVFVAASNTGFAQSATGLNSVENMGASTNILATATSTTANLNAATQGAAEIWLLVAALPAS